jgi:hypothetical protein
LDEELKRWEKFSIKRLDNKAKRDFISTVIPSALFDDISEKLKEATTKEEIEKIFEEA